jgi:hypothetical protein
MRILYADRKNPEEAAALAELEGRMDAWWGEFAGKSKDLPHLFRTGGELGDLLKWMTASLRAIIPNMCWEFGPALKGKGFRLVITPEARHQDRPRVDLLLARAPKLAGGWEFYACRPAESVALTVQTVRGRTGRDVSGMLCRVVLGKNWRIDLTFASPACKGPEDRAALADAHIAAETLLGEEMRNQWIGAVAVEALAPGAEPAKGLVPLEKLRPRVVALVEKLREQLPPVPRHERSHPFFAELKPTVFKPQPRKAADYPARRDIFVATTREPALWSAKFSRLPFHSDCFSQHGEVFCYLKIDATDGFDPKHFGRGKSGAGGGTLEEAVDQLLLPARAGCVIGTASGLRYAYLDLALCDVPKAAKLLLPPLRKAGLPTRSWLLFFDSALAEEWIGVHPETPAPPMKL